MSAARDEHFQTLPGATRRIVWRLREMGLSYKDIARRIDIAPGYVANLLVKERKARGIPPDPRGRRATVAATA